MQVENNKLNNFAELLGSLIAKYADKIDLDSLPEPSKRQELSEEIQTA